MAITLTVHQEEDGQKLFFFLKRCLHNEDAELYRWIRSGQVRINSGRAKAISRVQAGDIVRVPPFALCKDSTITRENITENKEESGKNLGQRYIIYWEHEEKKIPIVYENNDILIINKPYNLASQAGTGHMGQSSNLVDILKKHYKDKRFTPAPAHRLDKETTGLMCIGKSHKALRCLSDFFANKSLQESEDKVFFLHKEYVLWVYGDFSKLAQIKNKALTTEFYLIHYVYAHEITGHTQVISLENIATTQNLSLKYSLINIDTVSDISQKIEDLPESISFEKNVAKIAISKVSCLKVQGEYSLLKIGLLTGRKHQIRAQCAALGFSLVGDSKYFSNSVHKNQQKEKLKLHAFRLSFEKTLEELFPEKKDIFFEVLPPWQGKWKIE